MELIMLMGIPASGKSSFYKTNFFNTHMRISLDLYNTRNKEKQFLDLAFALHQRIVIDNTNVTKAERKLYIDQARMNRYKIAGYYLQSKLSISLDRNEQRSENEKINKVGVIAKYKSLEQPVYGEGFNKLYYVKIENDKFIINDWSIEAADDFTDGMISSIKIK
jgi:predicted kinase